MSAGEDPSSFSFELELDPVTSIYRYRITGELLAPDEDSARRELRARLADAGLDFRSRITSCRYLGEYHRRPLPKPTKGAR